MAYDGNRDLEEIKEILARVFEKTGGGFGPANRNYDVADKSYGYDTAAPSYDARVDLECVRDKVTALLSRIGHVPLYGKPFGGVGPSTTDARAELEKEKAARTARGEAPFVAPVVEKPATTKPGGPSTGGDGPFVAKDIPQSSTRPSGAFPGTKASPPATRKG